MALPKENPPDENELEGFVSQPDESAADAATQLEPLLNLLADLKIFAGSNQQNAEPEDDSSGKNNQAGALGGLMDLLGISEQAPEEVTASVPETGSRQPESGDSPPVADEFKSLLFATHKLNTSELEKDYSSAKTIDVSAIAQPDLEEGSKPVEELSNLTMKDSLQYVQAQKSHGIDRHLQDLSASETESKPSEIPHNPIVSTVSEPPETAYLDPVVASSLQSIPNLVEQPTTISQPAEILGQIKQDLNEADSAMETLQNLIFGSKISDIEQVKNLLAENDLPGVRHLMAKIDDKLGKLEHQIYDPQELIELMLPWIAEILSRKVADSREEVVKAIVPIIDEVIRAKTQENKSAMSAAIAELLPDALAQQIVNSPADIAKAIAPEIGLAIKEQIRLDQESIAQALAPEMGKAITAQIKLERDSMVDALYPVIGSTISRYMAEAIKTINEKVSNAISVEGFQRKIRSKVQGVSEAELILKESVPFTVQAAFLIHKASGLIISEVQNSESYQLESEMVAGMLTAIRSFVNECIVEPGEVSELNQIEYGDSKIMLEVAGYCYMAVVIKGEPPQSFINKLRQTVSNIILNYAKVIHEFNGDSGTIPESLHPYIKSLFDPLQTKKSTKPPIALAAISLAALSLILVPWGIYQYRSNIYRRLEANAIAALASTPELAVYRLDVAVDGKTLKLTGKLPNQELRAQAEKIAASTAPQLQLDNRILAVDVPPDPVLTAAEVQRITAVLNQKEGLSISTRYGDRKVTVEGTVRDGADAQKIAQSLKQIPGVQSVISTVKLDPLKITTRIYFQQGTATLDSTYRETIASVKNFMDQYPQKQIKIIGHSDRTGELATNQQLSLRRAAAVRDALVRQGADPKRLQTVGIPHPPADVEPNQPRLLSRCVVFEPITKTINRK
ncbi:OmpA/MotB domain protein [Oscillatoria nigro-viridis PCC 7112]|uniref:OmpA/MotB domain protein n=1 Tax=Phormidium nigroviride PCC 7112 TaxID=179408 RepID=K9VDU2_9CYAN|nr:OmpA family protein [Oscillatoria nigro-viridis]AFZ05637.1 OmpA/MotB domain protein [Oscillatoria nigro-viridis PCC 7112]